MENYYTEIIDEIKTALEKGEIEEAEYLLKKEYYFVFLLLSINYNIFFYII